MMYKLSSFVKMTILNKTEIGMTFHLRGDGSRQTVAPNLVLQTVRNSWMGSRQIRYPAVKCLFKSLHINEKYSLCRSLRVSVSYRGIKI